MSTLTISDLDPSTAAALASRAHQKGHSVEIEARNILTQSVATVPSPEVDLAEAIRRRFAPFGGVDDLELPPRTFVGEPMSFED